MCRFTCFFILIFGFSLPAVAADVHPYDSPNIFGQAIWIGEGEQRFPAIYAEAAVPEAKGIVLMLHAEGEHPQWPMVIQVLREQLTDHGWNTLALQLPRPAASSRTLDRKRYTDMVNEKLQMAVEHIQPMNPPVMVLLGHGLGANTVIQRAAQQQDDNLLAIIGVSINAAEHQTAALNTIEQIGQLKLPILDVYAERDRFEVRQSTKQRKRAALKAGNKHYRQLQIPGADHHFYNHTTMLGSRVKSWLDATYRNLPKDREQLLKALHKFRMPVPVSMPAMEKPMQTPATDTTKSETMDTPDEEQLETEQPTVTEKIMEPAPVNKEEPPIPNPTGPEGLF